MRVKLSLNKITLSSLYLVPDPTAQWRGNARDILIDLFT
jgi:hypothetical protein